MTLHSDGDIVLHAPEGRVHVKAKYFSREADAGADGIVHFYPIPGNVNMIPDETFIHESGHTFSDNLWPKESDWAPWQSAMKADGKSVSAYADSDKKEDFSESLVMYTLSKGTPCEAQARVLYPNRYTLLDKVPTVPAPKQRSFFEWLRSLFSL